MQALKESLFGPCVIPEGLWFGLPAVSKTCSRCMLDYSRAALCHWFCSLIFLDRISSRRAMVGDHRTESSLFADDVVHQTRTANVCWGGLQPCVK